MAIVAAAGVAVMRKLDLAKSFGVADELLPASTQTTLASIRFTLPMKSATKRLAGCS